MKPNLALLLYFTGLIAGAVPILTTFPHKYELVVTPMSWADAQDHCRGTYSDLGAVQSETDWIRFNKEAESKALTSAAWVGLYNDVDSWRWSLNEFPLKNAPFKKWGYLEPDNNDGKDGCTFIGYSGTWWDEHCTKPFAFICYNANFSAADKFIGISTRLSWPEAQTYCRTHHTDLASALNSSDNDMLVQIRNAQGNSWIGLYRDRWKWSDGTDASDLTWASGEPDNSGGNQNCAMIHNGLFSDEACTDPHPFFCHIIFPVGQIMRMEVKSDGSVLEPAVQSFMVEKIEKRLEEKGEISVTVTWRVQPDGNIFHKKKKKKKEEEEEEEEEEHQL